MPKPKTQRATPRAEHSQPSPSPGPIEAAALDALADALAPRLFERLKRLAAEEAGRNAEDQDAVEFLEGLGWRRNSPTP